MFVCTVVFYSSLIAAFMVNELMLAGIIVLPVYLAYSYMFEDTTKYIYNVHEFDKLYENLILARNSKPILKMVIESFNKET